MDTFETKFHPDGTITVWNVYTQQWLKTSKPGDAILASLSPGDREKVIDHCKIK
jgi:hypothetical protein